MKLKDAVEKYRQIEGAPSNSYDWYRKAAQNGGYVHIGDKSVPAFKVGREWHVDDEEFEAAVNEHMSEQRQVENNTRLYAQGKLEGKVGESIKTKWGHVTFAKDFQFVHHNYSSYKDGSNGTWYCMHCNKPAQLKHEKEECHRCRDWNGCGRDCTLSSVYCSDCDKEMDV